MLKYSETDVVFREIPDETTLAINISNCPYRCKNCHSPHLQKDVGEVLDKEKISNIIDKYKGEITTVCFMGGDKNPDDIMKLAEFVKSHNIKVAWYSGKSDFYDGSLNVFDYIKLGQYKEEYGALDNPNTNQKLYEIKNGEAVNITEKLQKKGI